MKIPPRMEISMDECLRLKKIIYELMQTARQFVEAIKGFGFDGTPVDPYLWIWKIESVTGFISYSLDVSIFWRSKEKKGVTVSAVRLNICQFQCQ
jgi:hypothetical protein